MGWDDEVIAFASERVPLMTVFESSKEDVKELSPGEMMLVNHHGEMSTTQFAPAEKFQPCSFERIYFSRGNDPDIYAERQAMGAMLVDQVVKSMHGNFEKAVFSRSNEIR